MNNGDGRESRIAMLEGTKRSGRYSTYGRTEFVEVETGVLLGDHSSATMSKTRSSAFTVGTVRDASVVQAGDGVGGAATFYGVPERLETATASAGVAQVFVRVRPAAGMTGRMWNMHMIKSMHPAAVDPHAGHQMP